MPILLRFIIAVFAKTLSKLFSLATVSFLGRVPSRDDSKISFIGLLSLYWLFVAFSLSSPQLASVVIPFLPNDPLAIRIASIGLLVVIPLIVGWMTTKMENYNEREASFKKQLMKGYPYTLLLGLLVVALIVSIPIAKAPIILKRYNVENLKIMIKKGEYQGALGQIEAILAHYDIHASVRSPSKPLWGLFIVLVWVLNSIFNRAMSKDTKILKGDNNGQDFQITLHATDISIAAKRKTATELMAVLSEELDETHLYFSWDDDSQNIEDEIKEIQDALERGEDVEESSILGLAEHLRTLELSKEEWNAIRRQIYKLECKFHKYKG